MSDPQTIPPEPSAAPRLKKWLVILLLCVVAAVGSWEGYRFAKLHLSLRYARREFSKRQFMRAEFWADRAFSMDGKNTEAMRLMAEINEAQDRSVALGWRVRVTQREPGNTADTMALAKSALRFGEGETAVGALKSLPQDFKDRSAEYHELMAGCALATHDAVTAGSHFARAAELDPSNPVHRVNVEAFQLTNSPDATVREASALKLEGALDDPRVSLYAARALLRDAIRGRDRARAARFAEKLGMIPEHTFSDDLTCLEAVMGEPGFHPALEAIERRAESDPLWAMGMGDWLNARGMAAETLRWYAKIPEPVHSNVRVQMTVSESYCTMNDWTGLVVFLAQCHWEDGEFLRRALLVRCKRALSQPWEKEWRQLASDMEAKPPDNLLLAQLVIGWQWRDEALGLLRGAEENPMTKSRALQCLWDIYSRTGDTAKLWRVARSQTEMEPLSPVKKNNEAFLSLLLHGASERSERLAREASTANPAMPEWAATYAYALHLAGKDREAKKVMEALPPSALARPGIALYYAIMLTATGDESHARELLVKLNTAGMLPEEQKLAMDLAQRLKPGAQ